MSGTASVPTQFQNAVTATGLQLDNNFATVVAYLNDPTNRNNYALDTGNTNTIALAFSPPFVGGYTAGMEITFKAAFTNSGAAVVNANSLGNKNLVNPDGSALTASQVVVGSTYKAVYDGTRFIFLTPGTFPATQAQIEAETTANVFVQPQQIRYGPGVAKAWASFTATAVAGTITPYASYNISQIVCSGTGTWAISFVAPFSTAASYGHMLVPMGSSTSAISAFVTGNKTVGTITYVIQKQLGASAVPTPVQDATFIAYGDQ